MSIRSAGFTLVELIMVILMLGILSAYAMSRMADSTSFDRRAIEQHWLSVLRQARQLGLSRADQGAVTLTISQQGELWVSEISSSDGETLSSEQDRSGLSLHLGVPGSGACSSLGSTPITLSLDGSGQLSPYQNQRLCVDANPTIEFCISASGHVSSGSCP